MNTTLLLILTVSAILITAFFAFKLLSNQKNHHFENIVKDDLQRGRQELREMLNESSQNMRLENKEAFKEISEILNKQLAQLREENSKKLEEMRATVDEKLQKTLNERLAQSFKQVSDHLDAVNKGLGEMKTLAHGVGDLKKVLSNVKTRGGLGEIQLGNILQQILTSYQYEKNVATRPQSNERVEFAIKLPGKEMSSLPVWLPLDSKFPLDPYQHLLDAYETGQSELIKSANKELEVAIKKSAKDIREKYLEVPFTTDFGILFLPIEGLYAEVVRNASWIENLHNDYRVVVTGPSTLAALLNSLQMGFQTLTFEKRSHEIRQTLGAVKTEFAQFAKVLSSVQNRLHGASDDLEKLVGTRTRKIQLRLHSVEEASEANDLALLDEPEFVE